MLTEFLCTVSWEVVTFRSF